MRGLEHRRNEGFTAIELVIVLAIIGILVTLAISSYINMIGQYRLSAECRILNQTIQDARLRSISTGISHGVAFERRNFPQTDRYFIFVDCAAQIGATVTSTGDQVYTDPDGDFTNNGSITELSQCNSVDYDPVARQQIAVELAPGNSLGEVIDWTKASDAGTAPLEYVAFNPQGQMVRGSLLAIGAGGTTEITIERNLDNGERYESGVTMSPGTGLSYTFPIRKKF